MCPRHLRRTPRRLHILQNRSCDERGGEPWIFWGGVDGSVCRRAVIGLQEKVLVDNC